MWVSSVVFYYLIMVTIILGRAKALETMLLLLIRWFQIVVNKNVDQKLCPKNAMNPLKSFFSVNVHTQPTKCW